MARQTENEVILIGGLGRDPQIKPTAKATVCELALATTDGSKDKKVTNWHKVVLFGTMAENAAKYLTKGSQVYVKGTLQYNDWTDKNGSKHHDAQVVAFKVIYLDSGKKAEASTPEDDWTPPF